MYIDLSAPNLLKLVFKSSSHKLTCVKHFLTFEQYLRRISWSVQTNCRHYIAYKFVVFKSVPVTSLVARSCLLDFIEGNTNLFLNWLNPLVPDAHDSERQDNYTVQ